MVPVSAVSSSLSAPRASEALPELLEENRRADLQPTIPEDLAMEWALAASSEDITGKVVESVETCAICLEPLLPGSANVIKLPQCQHSFHLICTATMQLPPAAVQKDGDALCAICRHPFQLASLRPAPSQSVAKGAAVDAESAVEDLAG